MAIKKVTLPDNTTQDINDARVVSDGITYIGETPGSTTYEVDGDVVDISDYARKDWVEAKGYLTSHQSLKTINNQSIVGTGNITISGGSEVTESTVAGWGFTKNTGTYSMPSGGIPATDLASAVQTSLGKADTALQSYTETDPVFTASAAHGISSTDISNWNAKQKAITISSSEPTSSQGSDGDIWIVI